MLAVVALLVVGCTVQVPAPPDQQARFLDDYALLRPDQRRSGSLEYLAPNADLNAYTKIMVDPVAIYYRPVAGSIGIRPDELLMVTEHVRTTIAKALAPMYPVADEAGPEVLRVRAAITHVEPVAPIRNELNPAVVRAPISIRGSQIELELIDSLSNKQIAALVDAAVGRTPAATYSWAKWSDALAALDAWGGRLRERISELRARQAPGDGDSA